MYPNRVSPVAAGRNSAARSNGLIDRLAYVARRLRFAVPRLGDPDRQFLRDLARSEARYPMKALDRLIDYAAQAPNDADAEALPEAIRAEILTRRQVRAPSSLYAAFETEEESNGPANVAQLRCLVDPSEPNRERAREALIRQLTATRTAIDALSVRTTQ